MKVIAILCALLSSGGWNFSVLVLSSPLMSITFSSCSIHGSGSIWHYEPGTTANFVFDPRAGIRRSVKLAVVSTPTSLSQSFHIVRSRSTYCWPTHARASSSLISKLLQSATSSLDSRLATRVGTFSLQSLPAVVNVWWAPTARWSKFACSKVQFKYTIRDPTSWRREHEFARKYSTD